MVFRGFGLYAPWDLGPGMPEPGRAALHTSYEQDKASRKARRRRAYLRTKARLAAGRQQQDGPPANC